MLNLLGFILTYLNKKRRSNLLSQLKTKSTFIDTDLVIGQKEGETISLVGFYFQVLKEKKMEFENLRDSRQIMMEWKAFNRICKERAITPEAVEGMEMKLACYALRIEFNNGSEWMKVPKNIYFGLLYDSTINSVGVGRREKNHLFFERIYEEIL